MRILAKVLSWGGAISGNKSMNEVFKPTISRFVLTCRATFLQGVEVPARDWSPLSRYGSRDYKFIQRDSYNDFLNLQFPGGVCMGVAMNWIQERLTTSNGFFRPEGHLRNPVTRHFANPLNPLARLQEGISVPGHSLLKNTLGRSGIFEKGKSGTRNQSGMLLGAQSHFIYSRRGVDGLAQQLGLVEDNSHAASPWVERDPISNMPRRREDATIASAAVTLPNGHAMLIELKQEGAGAGHAIAWYRSRHGTLYFFDPNAGVYTVPDGEARIHDFVAVWRGVYRGTDNIDWKTTENSWCRIYRRAHREA